MRRGIERDGVKVSDMTDLVHALCTCVLASHDVPAQVDGDGVRAVHVAFLVKCFNRPAALNRGIQLVDALPEAKSVRFLNHCFEVRPRQAI